MGERIFRELLRIRRVEERIAEIYPTDRIKSPVHLSIGQEAISVAVCAALEPQDVVFGTYRGHALYLAKGGSMRGLVAELFGKETGCTKGKGGSMHLAAPEVGMFGASAVVGTTIPLAVGYAYAARLRQEPRVVASFFGEGATEEGVFFESLNFAALKQLPVLFVCENNFYAIHTHERFRQAELDRCAKARAMGVPADSADVRDLDDLLAKSMRLVDEIRAGGGPRFLEVAAYRWREHVGPGEDFHLGHRDASEAKPWIDADPLHRLGEKMPLSTLGTITAEVEAEIADAFRFADESPFPGPWELLSDVFGGAAHE